jgi:hypothetical protein
LRVGSVLIAEIAFDLLAVGVVVRERGVHLGEGEVPEILGDFLRAEAEHVPAGDPLNGDTETFVTQRRRMACQP